MAVLAALLFAAACTGSWSVNPQDAPVRAVHVALLRTGKVLLVSGSGNNFTNFAAGTFSTSIWDPNTNTFSPVTTPWDAFCSGHAFLADGRLLVAGGTQDYPRTAGQTFAGTRKGYVFNPATSSYTAVPDMSVGRWYPTLVTLGNGNILSVAGLDENRNTVSTAETFNASTSTWSAPTQPPSGSSLPLGWPLYPSLHLLADGRLFFSGVTTFNPINSSPGIWNLSTNSMTGVPGLSDAGRRDQGMSVLLPPAQSQKVMVFGGGFTGDSNPAVTSTAIADLSKPNPTFTAGPTLSEPKMYVSAVILPNSNVLETGGARTSRESADDPGYTYSTQIYDPSTGQLTDGPPSTIGRGYHSSAILLPDGRVATFGNNPRDGSFEMRIEIFRPAYMFKDRPVIDSVATELPRGVPTPIATHGKNLVTSAVLVRPMAATHSTDTEQRLVDLTYSGSGSSATVTVPTNPNLLPPGWYMLFARDGQRTPSVARWVHVS